MARRKKPTDDETNENLNKSNDSSDDTFGLPDIEYKPLDRVEEKTTVVETTTTVDSSQESEPEQQQTHADESSQTVTTDEQQPPEEFAFEEESSPVWPKVLGILIIVLLAVGTAWYFVVYKPKLENERLALLEKERNKARQDSLNNVRAADEARLEAERKRKADSLAAIPKTGIFETLTERTGRYYVVAASAVDDDLLVDHAKKLAEKGVSTKLIPPFRKYKFYRLTIGDAETFEAAQQLADSKKAEYTDALWVLKY